MTVVCHPNGGKTFYLELNKRVSGITVGKMISKKATEVHGGMGFTDLLGLHYWFKRIGLNRQILGAPEIVREEAAELQGFNQ